MLARLAAELARKAPWRYREVMMSQGSSEFRPDEELRYDLRGPGRWLLSHLLRYPWLPALALASALANNVGGAAMQVLVGRGFDLLAKPGWEPPALLALSLLIGGAAALRGLARAGFGVAFEFLAQRVERDARAELYASLLGKSQTFHSRQRLGDVMARATNDVHYLNLMLSPGVALILDSFLTIAVPFFMIAAIDARLLLTPVVFTLLLVLTVWDYNRRLGPAADEQRARFGELNAGLADALEGIETVKANLGEGREIARFAEGAGRLRDLYIRIARIEGRYWPLLVFALCWAAAFFHALVLWREGAITMGQAIGFVLLFSSFRFATFISLWSFNLLQMGLSSAERVLGMISARTDLDENPRGHAGRIEGKVEFRRVTFSFCGSSGCEAPAEGGRGEAAPTASPRVLRNVSFVVEPGQTVAVVGRTGSGKTSLLKLVNRIFDADSGQVLVDGVDVRDWNLESLRSQIASIEQDVFLYSRSIRDNIAFGRGSAAGVPADPAGAAEAATAEAAGTGPGDEGVERAARDARAHDFIMGFERGYATEVGERGVTLSGGQRQRIAIARALLVDPRILILDDSTSAVDSRTEDEIQQAIKRASAGRTTFIVTHRLHQIRWADRILLLRGGELAASGTHAELLEASEDYRRLFART